MLLRVTANDIDIQPVLTYDLLTLTDMFTVDKYSGKLSLTGKLDYETRTAYNLTVMVTHCSLSVDDCVFKISFMACDTGRRKPPCFHCRVLPPGELIGMI